MTPDEYHAVECQRGREFIIRLTTGADVFLAVQKFAIDQKIRFAKIHAAFMGGLAIGSAFLGRWADGRRRPLRAYAALEVGIAAVDVRWIGH